MSKGVLFNLISLSTRTILASQKNRARDTKKKSRYCLLNSKASKLKGSQKSGSKKTSR